MSKPYIYTSLTLIKHRSRIKVTICNIFPASLTVAKLVKHRSHTPKQTSMWVICKESSIIDIDVKSWAWCAHREPYNFSLCWLPWSWTKENFCFWLRSSNASIFNHQYSVISYQVYLQLPCKNQQPPSPHHRQKPPLSPIKHEGLHWSIKAPWVSKKCMYTSDVKDFITSLFLAHKFSCIEVYWALHYIS